MIPTTYSYAKPSTLEEAFALLETEGTVLLAGGTDVLINLRNEKIEPNQVLDLKGLEELKGIRPEGDKLFIGATTSVQDVAESPLAQPYQAVVAGASQLGCYEIRLRATIGGNICNGSPSADTVPGLLVHDAQVILASKEGRRTLALSEFLVGPGKVDLSDGELLVGILLPAQTANAANTASRYYRRTRAKGMDLSGLGVAVYHGEGPSAFRIALGAVLPTVARMSEAEALLNGAPFTPELLDEVLAGIVASVAPRKGSLRATPEYKKAMIPVLIKQGFLEIMGGEQ
jgi:CO/xanthine dehydrogenase FAD-binding subunit